MIVLSLQQYLDRWSELHGGHDPRRSRLVGGWLRLGYLLAAPGARIGVRPDLLTLLGVVLAGAALGPAALGGRWVIAAAALVAMSAVADGLDGAVAVLTGRDTAWGAVLDSLADRVSDACFLLALWLVGAPAWACLGAGVLAYALEYARARGAAVGVTDIAVVTVGERPTRVAVSAMFLLAAGVFPSDAAGWAAAGAYVAVVVGAGALVQLLVVLGRRLR